MVLVPELEAGDITCSAANTAPEALGLATRGPPACWEIEDWRRKASANSSALTECCGAGREDGLTC